MKENHKARTAKAIILDQMRKHCHPLIQRQIHLQTLKDSKELLLIRDLIQEIGALKSLDLLFQNHSQLWQVIKRQMVLSHLHQRKNHLQLELKMKKARMLKDLLLNRALQKLKIMQVLYITL